LRRLQSRAIAAIAGISVPDADADADAVIIITRRARTDPCVPLHTICYRRRPPSWRRQPADRIAAFMDGETFVEGVAPSYLR
jgi:hypothetical protein